MAAKKKIRKEIDEFSLYEQDEILIALKERYFKLLIREDFGKTKQITDTLDKLEIAINTRKEIIINEIT